VCFNPETRAVSSGTSISENPEMFEFSGTSYLRKRHAFKNLRFGRRLAFLLSGKPKNMALSVSEMRVVMAKIVEFYIPERFQKTVRWVPELQRGKVIEFPLSMTRSASKESASAVTH
jgi:hypothetical protein